jgi:AraC-like DNA-binding protein
MIDSAPELAPFVENKAGLVLLFALMLGDDTEGEFSTERPVPVSLSALAQKFSVSRKHVLTLLRDAESQGLLRRTGDRGEQVILQPKLLRAVQNLVTEAFMLLSQSARAARREIGLA